jgi:uncharacterized protein YuzE
MSSAKHILFVRSTRAPIVEIDAESGGVYVRFSDKAVAKTIERQSDGPVITVDVDRQGEVVGIEGLCFTEFSLSQILRQANVRADHVDLSKARFRTAVGSREAAAA